MHAAAVNQTPGRLRMAPRASSSSSLPRHATAPAPLLRRRRSRCFTPRATNPNEPSSSPGLSDSEIEALLRKYDSESPKPSIPPRSRSSSLPKPSPSPSSPPAPARRGPAAPAPTTASSSSSAAAAGNGTFLLCFLCLAMFVADNVLHLPFARVLYLVHGHGSLISPWWTVATHAFAHANWAHLSANLFPLLIFGKLVEETEGAVGVVFYYLLTAAGAALASVWLTPGPAVVSVGASGAVFGLFSIAVLTRLSADPRKLLEFFILGQFVVGQVLSEAKAQAAGGMMLAGGLAVSHVAHLAGALAGVLLVMLLRAIPEPPA